MDARHKAEHDESVFVSVGISCGNRNFGRFNFLTTRGSIIDTRESSFRKRHAVRNLKGARGLRAIYVTYYDVMRTHLSLGKDAPMHRGIQRSGVIAATPILSGSHHHYARI